MFDFTTTTFIHNANMIEANPATGSAKPSSNLLRIGNIMFKKENIVAIYRNPYVKPLNGKLYVDIAGMMDSLLDNDSTYKDAERFKIDFYIRRSGDVNSYYSNAYGFKGKDFHYEWTRKQNTAEKVAKVIKNINKLYGDIYLKVYAWTDASDHNKEWLVFENDNYALFTEATLSVYMPDWSDCCTYREAGWTVVDELSGPVYYCDGTDECSNTYSIPTLSSENNLDYYSAAVEEDQTTTPPTEAKKQLGGWIKVEQGVNGAGTYEQIMKDLRLPTAENTRWLTPNASEMPMVDGKYVQYTFHQIACRGILGGSAVGEVTHSKTTHVFFVPTCGCGDDLDSTMKDAIIAAFGTGEGSERTCSLLLSVNNDGQIGIEEKDSKHPVIKTDPVTNPIEAENFEYSPEDKADTVNITEE